MSFDTMARTAKTESAVARAGQLERVMHTHLAEPEEETALCNKKIGLADYYSCTEEERSARPTCPKCAKRYDKNLASRDNSKGPQMKLDSRFTIHREYTGHASGKPQYVARFMGNWIGSSGTRAGAVKLATKWETNRNPAYSPRRSPVKRRASSAPDCGCSRSPSKDCGCGGPKRDFAPIRKIKKKIAIYRLKLAVRALWQDGGTFTEKAQNVVERAREVAILSGLSPEQVARIEQEVLRFGAMGLASAREIATRRIVKPAKAKTRQLTARVANAYARDPAYGGTGASKACGMSTEIQTLVLSQQLFNERQAIGWVKRHGFRVTKVDVTANNYRFRQHPPTNFEAGSFRTIRLRAGVQAVIGCPQ